MSPEDPNAGRSNRRWFGLVVLAAGLFIVILDQTVLNVAIPSILRDFNTNLSSLQWVISGYSLIFASLLISFGRIGDLFGRRLIFIIGALLFGLGSLLASVSHSAGSLFIGEALIEGIGAAMMLPSTLSLITSEFSGRERGLAFAVWGAVAASAGTFGPLVGGYLTTFHSWRWAFRINVVVAPLAVLGALLFIRESKNPGQRERLDIPGVITVSLGLFGVVFALIEAATYGWLKPLQNFTLGNSFVWPYHSFSIVTMALVLGLFLLGLFYSIERDKEKTQASPLFDFSLFDIKSFRYGILTTLIIALGEFGLIFVLPIFLQTSKQLTAYQAGAWGLPMGLAAIVAAPISGLGSRRFGPKWLISAGMVLETIGVFYAAHVFTVSASFWSIAPALVIYGFGIGLATTQLVNVVLHDVPVQRSGAASGMNGTVRQVGSALGIAIIGAILAAQISHYSKLQVASSQDIPAAAKSQIIASLSTNRDSFQAATGVTANNPQAVLILAETSRIVRQAAAKGARSASVFAGITMLVGVLLSLLVPNIAEDAPNAESIDDQDQPELPILEDEGMAVELEPGEAVSV